MTVAEWNERYRTRAHTADFDPGPAKLVVETAQNLPPGRALDLACGAGRNALWLAEKGWSVTAVDGAEAAIAALRSRAAHMRLPVDAHVADLSKGEFEIEEARWDVILMCYYLQRDLLEPAKKGLAPGGIVIVIAHIPRPGEEPSATRARPGELRTYFDGCEVLHYYEGDSRDAAHHRPVAEIVARRPA
jgi:SAM-dependent methyltransferase